MTTAATECMIRLYEERHELEDYQSGVPRWCSGCGDNAILAAVQRLCRDEQLRPERTVFVSGIGCSSRFPHYMKTYGFHGIHGRALPIAEGVRMARPDLNVFVNTGDGDCCSIGAAHWIHAIRYNMNMTVFLHDNQIYGLTKMQASPTSPKGLKSNTTPRGAYLEALNPLTVTLGVQNVSFVAQAVDWIPEVLYDIVKAAFHHKGFSFVRIIQRCPEWLPKLFEPWLHDPQKVKLLHHEHGLAISPSLAKVYRNQEQHDPSDLDRAREIASSDRPDPGRHPVPQPGRSLLRGPARRAANCARPRASRRGSRRNSTSSPSGPQQGSAAATCVGVAGTGPNDRRAHCSWTWRELQSQVAFHLTGRRPAAGLEAVDPLALRPALLARYRDLTALRYDFPLVLGRTRSRWRTRAGPVRPRSTGCLQEIARGDDGERLTRHVLRLERQIRSLLAEGAEGLARRRCGTRPPERLGVRDDDAAAGQPRAGPRRAQGRRRRSSIAMPRCPRVSSRTRGGAVQQAKAARFRGTVGRLIQKLSDILARGLRALGGGTKRGKPEGLDRRLRTPSLFDFDAMSRLSRARRRRRRRCRTARRGAHPRAAVGARIAAVLSGSRGCRHSGRTAMHSCSKLRAAHWQPIASALARDDGRRQGHRHGGARDRRRISRGEARRVFRDYGEDGLDPDEIALFPDYLVCVNARKLDATETATLMEILSAGLPMKVLVQTDDILEESPIGGGTSRVRHCASRQLANMAIGLSDVYVLQSASSNLFQFREQLRRGLRLPGARAVQRVFRRDAPRPASLPPYLVAAAAMESRAFPAFTYDPAAGPDWASRFDLRPTAVGPGLADRVFAYEDEAHQRVTRGSRLHAGRFRRLRPPLRAAPRARAARRGGAATCCRLASALRATLGVAGEACRAC